MQLHRSRFVRWLLGLTLMSVAVLSSAAWSNGPNGGDSFGTHDWVLCEANLIASRQGYSWLDWSIAQRATDDPDTTLRDTYHHVYDVWGSSYGDAPDKVQELFEEVVQELQSGDRLAASRSFGLLAHYYADVCQPLHTDQVEAEARIHSRYELDAQKLTDEAGENRAWLGTHRIARVSDVQDATRRVAVQSHASYVQLVSEYSSNGMQAGGVLSITRQSLTRAVYGLADLLATAKMESGTTGAPARSVGQTRVNRADASVPTTPATLLDATKTIVATTVPSPASAAPIVDERAGQRPQDDPERNGRPSPTIALIVVSAVFASALFGALSSSGRGRSEG